MKKIMNHLQSELSLSKFKEINLERMFGRKKLMISQCVVK